MTPPFLDFFGALRRHVDEMPDHLAFRTTGLQRREVFTWQRLSDEIRSLSVWLREAGVETGDRVAILMENQPRWVVAFVAIQSAGAVVVPLDSIAGSASAAANAQHAEVRYLIASPAMAGAAASVRDMAPSITGVLASEEDWDRVMMAPTLSTPLPLVFRTLDDPLAILYTGGTTGSPKGVLLSQRNLYRSIGDMLRIFPLSPADQILSVLPLFHVMPLLANLLAPVYTGASVVFLNQLDPRRLLEAFTSEGVTAFLCVPQFYYQIERRIREEVAGQPKIKRGLFAILLGFSHFLRTAFGVRAGRLFFRPVHAKFGVHLRAFGIGGAWFNPKSARFFADLGFQLFQAYGLTESGGLATATPLDRNGGFTCGPPVAHCEVQLSGTGEILIRGENVMQGYWRDAKASADVLRDGWLHTGDLGSFNAAGTLTLTGRAKDVIVLSSGKNVFPEELEQYFAQRCPAIKEICFIGVEGPEGAVLHCVAVTDADPEQVRREIAVAARDLPGYRRPGSLHVTGQPLPRTSTRKLQRFRIRELAEATTDTAKTVASVEPEVAELMELIRKARPSAGSGARDSHLELDLQLNSLERVELIANVERVYGISFDPETAGDIHTVGDLLDAIAKAPKASPAEEGWADWTELVRAPLSAEEKAFAKTYLNRRPFSEFAWYGFGRVLALLLRMTMRLRVEHPREFPRTPFLLCPNHLSYLDDPVIACSLPGPVFRKMFAVAATKYFRGPVATWLISRFRILPIDEDRNLLKGLRRACAGVEKGLNLIIFPEGTRSSDGHLQEIRKGAAIIACALRVPVVPVGLSGTFEAWPRGQRFPQRHPIAISYGEPLFPEPNESADAFGVRLAKAMAMEIESAQRLRAS